MFTSDDLYGMAPDKLLVSDDFTVWYAFYDDELSVLSNAEGTLKAYSYDNKSEYREVRRFIKEQYPVKETNAYTYDED